MNGAVALVALVAAGLFLACGAGARESTALAGLTW
jgi:hypothetical protein